MKDEKKQRVKYGCDCSVNDSGEYYRHYESVYTSIHDYVHWGRRNDLPYLYYDLFLNCGTLGAIINRTAYYTMGKGLNINSSLLRFENKANSDDESLFDTIYNFINDTLIFGGYSAQLINSRIGKLAELKWIDMRNFRISENRKHAYVHFGWHVRTTAGGYKLPIYNPGDEYPTSIYYYKGTNAREWYPIPVYYSAIKSIRTLIGIDEWNERLLYNNFSPTVIVNVNNGVPSYDEKEALVEDFNTNYTGPRNAGKPFWIFNDNKEQAATVERLGDDNYQDKYSNLEKSSKQNIYSQFGINPVLAGINMENIGFNEQEFESAYKLYNITTIRPLQMRLEKSFDELFNMEGSVRFIPFETTL